MIAGIPKNFPFEGTTQRPWSTLQNFSFEDQKVPKAVTLKELLDAVCNCIHVYLHLPFPVVVLLPQTWEHLWKAWSIWYMLKAPPKLLLRPKPEETSDNSEKVVSFGRWISRISRWSYPQGLAVQIKCWMPLKQVEKPAPKTLKQKAGHNWKGAWVHYVHNVSVVLAWTHITAPVTSGTFHIFQCSFLLF